MSESIIIEKRFCGPPDSGNGGYTCGMVARVISGPAEVRLRRPVPLDRPLMVERIEQDSIQLRDGDEIVAEARPIKLDLSVPEPPSYREAEAAARHYAGFEAHTFPTCFVCGPERAAGDGLHIFPGAIPERDLVAAPWVPGAALVDQTGNVRSEIIWAALDCPGAFAAMDPERPAVVLGTLAASIERPLQPGERCVVIGWKLGAEGRKLYSGTAVFSESNQLCARARATWIEINSPHPRS